MGPHIGIISLRQLADKLVSLGQPGSLLYSLLTSRRIIDIQQKSCFLSKSTPARPSCHQNPSSGGTTYSKKPWILWPLLALMRRVYATAYRRPMACL